MLSWFGIMRLGLVQMSLGAIVVLTTATMNRVMVVELAMPAILPGLLVSIYYGTQFLRPRFGHSADQGGQRTPWVIGGVALLAAGAIGAALSVGLMERIAWAGIATAIPSFLLIGLGIGAAGTNLLALLSTRVSAQRQAPAGSLVWIMMIFGLAVTGITAGQLLDPYSHGRLVAVTLGVSAVALTLTCLGIWGQERGEKRVVEKRNGNFRAILRELWVDPRVRIFTIFVFASMLAYNLQDLILEPFAGHVFGLTVGESTKLGGMHHAGALMGMIAVLLGGTVLARWFIVPTRVWVVGGCLLSGVSLVGLAYGGLHAASWPIGANIFVLGLANGAFAVAAIGAMMGLAREGGGGSEGVRMGLFGAAQAIAFGLGSFAGTAMVDLMRWITSQDAVAYGSVFAIEGLVFLVAAVLALRLTSPHADARARPAMMPGE
ncbi:MFS transporter [Roseobacter denitrificans]|uniref:PucC family protein, putative n=1 Tax=Roseobacter denitrificans (strain ATCC 33942 / OCh 114) TaxID=375451 RepID=Q16DR4_ROSDO|nr:BCD family MFS transporter [Roseobacter denitrificans]ABG29879.1 PucC family protein, putative [Roseobacter denitrificans OCh 114]AVL53095.1 MFS transporter [Roseobacter denitrificans]SFG25347.1 MFS transporter, BCD family, chlorophyll transporter [Roseobacter denitrificans OCh 114]